MAKKKSVYEQQQEKKNINLQFFSASTIKFIRAVTVHNEGKKETKIMALKIWHTKRQSKYDTHKKSRSATTLFVESFLLACCQHEKNNTATQESGKCLRILW